MANIEHVEDLPDLGPTTVPVISDTWEPSSPEPLPPPFEQPETEYDMPWDCAYGALADAARTLEEPPGLSYSVMLALYSSQGVPDDTKANLATRSTVYVVIAAGTGVGKSRVMDKGLRTLHGTNGMLLRDDPRHVKRFTASSAPGLQDRLVLEVPEGQKPIVDAFGRPGLPNNCLLHLNELNGLLNNLKIQNSNLPDMLTDLWDGNYVSTGTGKQQRNTNAHISIMGAVPCRTPTEFGLKFQAATMNGLFDRLIVVPQLRKWKFSSNWKPTPVTIGPWESTLPPEALAAVDKWSAQMEAAILLTDPDSTAVELLPRLSENARRVALISASASHESVVSPACIQAALRMATWQLKVKGDWAGTGAENPIAAAEDILTKALKKIEARDIAKMGPEAGKDRYYAYNYLMTSLNLKRTHKNIGSGIFRAAWDSMTSLGVLQEESLEEEKEVNGEWQIVKVPGKYTKRRRLARSTFSSAVSSQLVADDE